MEKDDFCSRWEPGSGRGNLSPGRINGDVVSHCSTADCVDSSVSNVAKKPNQKQVRQAPTPPQWHDCQAASSSILIRRDLRNFISWSLTLNSGLLVRVVTIDVWSGACGSCL